MSCTEDEEVTISKVNANFTSTSVGISEAISSADIQVQFSRTIDEDITVQIQVAATLEYGADKDYFTTPALIDDLITLSAPAGTQSVSFSVSAGEALNISEDRTLIFSLISAGSVDYTVGAEATVAVVFSENFLATSGIMELDAGGADFTKQAFMDLSKGLQLTYDKYSWDLGLYSDEGFNVVLNAPAYVMARKLDKSDMASVTAEDTAGFAGQMVIPQFDPSIGSSAWVDTPDGNLTTTAFGEISAIDSENSVYIIKRDGESRNWKKVRVLRSGTGYTLQYANISSSTFQSMEVPKMIHTISFQ